MTLKFSIIGVRINEKSLGTECIEIGNDPLLCECLIIRQLIANLWNEKIKFR